MQGNLYMLPSVLGDTPVDTVLPSYLKELVNKINYYIVENKRTARRFLIKLNIHTTIDDLVFFELNKHTRPGEIPGFLQPAMEGKHVGLISEAGLPAVADPGANVVGLAHNKGIRVIPVTGPSSIFLALMTSGLNGQFFAFLGYLPVKQHDRIGALKRINQQVKKSGQTQIFIETPYRNNQLLDDILKTCHDDLLLCVAVELTTSSESIRTRFVREWKKDKPDLHKKPAVFLIGS